MSQLSIKAGSKLKGTTMPQKDWKPHTSATAQAARTPPKKLSTAIRRLLPSLNNEKPNSKPPNWTMKAIIDRDRAANILCFAASICAALAFSANPARTQLSTELNAITVTMKYPMVSRNLAGTRMSVLRAISFNCRIRGEVSVRQSSLIFDADKHYEAILVE